MSSRQRLVLSIIDFLNQSIDDGTVKQDDKESLEVAIQCIGEAFGVDPTDDRQNERLSVKPATLQSIFDVFIKTRDNFASPVASAAPPTQAPVKPSVADREYAEKFKGEGNSHMTAKQYDAAIEAYTRAITLDPTNPVYYSNRAAAYSSKNAHNEAAVDAEKAIEVEPSFVKAYHRLGHAHYCLGDFRSAASAFRRGLDIDPSNTNLNSGLRNAEARILPDDEPESVMTDAASSGAGAGAGGGLGGMADMLSGMGLGGGSGGMPDLSSFMNNPRMMEMAQQMMQNGGLERMMQNPAVANMMGRVQSGNMPSMAELMADPSLRELASQFGAGGAQ
ncbi:uncharacterized protein FIBRA_02370 [Fibroporia radiculosa]|uniref:SGTA homodimerisation domain-containing protein n=1 Tax=Fibroporia radiculosa TaxID=599839 RepID=J4GMT9_9APHY|nr:uncharacterized protein FIBRA_02370 [Fibroporia radiculosa]CCM00340.1 predicted protein [Fibroporia radiculosa]